MTEASKKVEVEHLFAERQRMGVEIMTLSSSIYMTPAKNYLGIFDQQAIKRQLDAAQAYWEVLDQRLRAKFDDAG